MLGVSVVHASEDAALAREIAAYLQRNCRIELDTAVVDGEHPLLDVIGRALSADALILLLSAHAVPHPLERGEWEPLFLEAGERHTEIAYVPVAASLFPRVLLRANVFDPSPGAVPCARALKRWLWRLRPASERPYFVPRVSAPTANRDQVDRLWQALADQAGSATIEDRASACLFASEARNDFQGVFWIDARGATLAGAAGELGAQLGLRLAGNLRSNIGAIRGIADQYRCLVVLEGPAPEVAREFSTLGRTSVLSILPAPLPEASYETARAHLEALATWVNGTAAVPPPGHVHRSFEWLLATPDRWSTACQFARAAGAFYKFHDRLAEAAEILDLAVTHALARRDHNAARECGDERTWILEGWGERPDVTVRVSGMEPNQQLPLW